MLRSMSLPAACFAAALAAGAATEAQAGWTGCHAGVMGGFASNDSKFPNLTVPPNLGGSSAQPGAVGGAELGCDLGLPFFVVGLGASYDFVEAAKASVKSERIGTPPSIVDSTVTTRTNIRSIAAVTARVGMDIGPVLLYLRGGGAMAPTKMHYNYTVAHMIAGTSMTDLDASKTRTGYALGAGAEFALTSPLSVKLEAMHYDFGACNCLFSGVYTHPRVGTMPVKRLMESEASINTLKVGLAYRM